MMLICSLAAQLVLFAGVLFFSAWRTIRPKGFRDGIISGTLVLYGLMLGLCFLFSVVIPALLISLGADQHVVANSFPEAIGNTAVFFMGWLPALIFAIMVRSVYDAGESARKIIGADPDTKPQRRR